MKATGQMRLFSEPQRERRTYQPFLTVELNRKGVLDVDTVKGCALGMAAHPNGGCYGECYAKRVAEMRGIDFSVSVSRKLHTQWHKATLSKIMGESGLSWYRVGTFGDPSHDWHNTVSVLVALRPMGMTPVVVTKAWIAPTDEELRGLFYAGAVINVSVSGMDTDDEREHRQEQLARFRAAGLTALPRVVTCQYGNTKWGRDCSEKQRALTSSGPFIDNPLRISKSNLRLLSGDIIATRRADSVGGGKLVSIRDRSTHLGRCSSCPDQCGIKGGVMARKKKIVENQGKLWDERVEYVYVESVIGSGYEERVSKLALEDGIAHRAARKNMQIHSAIIVLVNGEFAGFQTFQNNHDVGEFCVLQSVIEPCHYNDERYRSLVEAVLAQNTNGYPAFITTDPKSAFETPEMFESVGFVTNFQKSGFHYMTTAPGSDKARMKFLAHLTMVNVWTTTSADWLRAKRAWNALIVEAGEREDVPNPTFASRDGCWQGTSGFANVVTGHSHNGNASVLDPVACEVILRMFMPAAGRRVYNPFGGGVQFGFVAAHYGYDYVASEIRRNQCDANNKLCSKLAGAARWVQSDSSAYEPEGMFDLVFSCPPYYRVERYVDYDGASPDGEINSMATYAQFRDALFSGYSRAIEHLNDGCFFAIMTGDARGKDGGYLCSEAETELFLRDHGLLVYNRIVYVESAFTRMAHAKKTLHQRKFPKCEQKIIVAFKGNPDKIKGTYPAIGRL